MARPKGSTNHNKLNITAMVEQALSASGGVDYLIGVAKENPAAFCSLIKPLLVHRIAISGDDERPAIKNSIEISEKDRLILNKLIELRGVK